MDIRTRGKRAAAAIVSGAGLVAFGMTAALGLVFLHQESSTSSASTEASSSDSARTDNTDSGTSTSGTDGSDESSSSATQDFSGVSSGLGGESHGSSSGS